MSGDSAAQLLPDPATSRAVLIGGGRYNHLPELAPVHNNVAGLAAILRDPDVWGLPTDRCSVVLNPATTDHLIVPIKKAAEEATDTLLVYYAGHGLADTSGELHLAVQGSDQAKPYTQVVYKWFREPVRNSPARRRIVILDCCFSGLAIDPMGDKTAYAVQAQIDGSFLLTATPHNREALAPADQRYTAFTNELVSLLEEGLAGGARHLSLNQISNQIRARLNAKSLPVPQTSDRNNLGEQTCFRNKAYIAGGAGTIANPALIDAESREASRRVHSICVRESADFLRRERLAAHDSLYVERPVDRRIGMAIEELNPVKLRRTKRTSKRGNGRRPGEVTSRAVPPQAIVLSDGPGSGKTMLAVQLTKARTRWGAVPIAATDLAAERLRNLTASLGPDMGLGSLLQAKIPIVLAVDALERCDHRHQKHVIDLFKAVSELNERARREGLLAFPLLILFTLRDQVRDRWLTVFEGRNVIEIRGQITRFTREERDLALERYAAAYDYELCGELPAESADKLDLPLHLRILSETHQFGGETDAKSALGKHILSDYVTRKSESIVAMTTGVDLEQVRQALVSLATQLISHPTIGVGEVRGALGGDRRGGISREDSESLLRALIDERILEQVGHDLKFRQPGILEYLVADASVRDLVESGGRKSLEDLTATVADTSPASAAAVRADVEEIARAKSSDARSAVRAHYRRSAAYTGSRLSTLRFEIGAGARTSKRDLDSIYGSLAALADKDAWDAFFVVVAVANRQPAELILRAFVGAWDANGRRADRWKLLEKLRERGLLYRAESVDRVLGSRSPRDWETLLGSLAQEPKRERERTLAWLSGRTTRPLKALTGTGPSWRQVNGLLDLLNEGEDYVSGQIW